MIPAADSSDQIPTTGFESCGTWSMNFALNGAITIGTLDGANVEIREEVGDENIFIFGNTVEDVDKLRHEGYNPWDIYNSNDDLKQILDQLRDGFFNDDK